MSTSPLDAIPLIGEYVPPLNTFEGLDVIFQEFECVAFQTLSKRKQFKRINQILLTLIQRSSDTAFLLSSVVDYIARINTANLLPEPYSLPLFEFWLNHFAPIDEAERYRVRAKIMGKFLPREEYQSFFPVGNGSRYSGTHFVTAHLSPDLDTAISSFWGWVDAFAATVGTGLHVWCLPGGPPATPMFQIFYDLFGPALCEATARTALTLTLTAYDLVSQKNFVKNTGETSISTIDHGANEKAIILVDESGHYRGDWRSSDVELVRQVIVMFKSLLHWFENNLHIELISLFAKSDLTVNDISAFLTSVFDMRIDACEPVQEFNDIQRHDLDLFFTRVLEIHHGLTCTYRELSQAMYSLGVPELSLFISELQSLPYSTLFHAHGHLIEDRSSLLHAIERIIIQLDIAIHCIRNYVERLDIAMDVKNKVIAKAPPQYLTLKSDVEEIRLKMKSYNYLTIVIDEGSGQLFPIGVIWEDDLRRATLGTVSLRDFSNHEEVRMAPYLTVISVIDHHRVSLTTSSTPLVIIGDAQSSNVLLAELTYALNDRYSTGGMSTETIKNEFASLNTSSLTPASGRLHQRLLQRALLMQNPSNGFIHPQREYAEYLTFLYGILDDTDLLTKVTARDVLCVASLLNRLKSLIAGTEVEIIQLDDLPRDSTFAKEAARRILQQKDMYSIYHRLYAHRERDVEEQIVLCGRGEASDIFADTKELNRCCRVGQTKLFASNIPTFQQYSSQIRKTWRETARISNSGHPEIDLHMHMLSTIASADEVHQGLLGDYSHRDELWFWGPPTWQARAHLSSFLLGFQSLPELRLDPLLLTICAPAEEGIEIEEIFHRHFLPTTLTINSTPHGPWAILSFRAGILNSRKGMITPFLPRIVA